MQALLISPFIDEADILAAVLQHAGFIVHRLQDVRQVVEDFETYPSEFIILSMSKQSTEVINQVRRLRGSVIAPLIIITDPLSETMHINLLDSGVDLVVTRPYSSRLLIYQIRALLRRSNSMPFLGLPQLTLGDVSLDPASRSVTVGSESPRHLTQLEFRLLYMFITHVGEIISAENLVEHIWGYPGEGNRELVRGLVQRLRMKIEADPHNPRYILTEPGVGYVFQVNNG
jgi:DNA-binding response OmpR family regulator